MKLPKAVDYHKAVEERTLSGLVEDLWEAMDFLDDAQFYISVIQGELEKRIGR